MAAPNLVEQLRRRLIHEKALRGSRPRRKPKLGRPHYPHGLINEYSRAVAALFKEAKKNAIKILEHRLPVVRKVAGAQGVHLRDDWTDEATSTVNAVKTQMEEDLDPDDAESLAEEYGSRIDRFNKRDSYAYLSALGGNDLSNEGWLKAAIVAFAAEGSAAMEAAVTTLGAQMTAIVFSGIRSGQRYQDIVADIVDRFNISISQAQRSVENRVSQFNAELTRTRQIEAGIEKYGWATMEDDKVRETHAELDGTIQSWYDPPITNEDGDRNHPGEDWGPCRCIPIPVLPEDVLGPED